MFNVVIQAFASGATGFNVFASDGMYDMSLWLAMRDAIALVQPYEDLICDGMPIAGGAITAAASAAVVNGMMSAAGEILIASSTIPHGLPTQFTVASPHARASWVLCDLATNESVNASSAGVARWTNTGAEDGSVLAFGPATPCHSHGSAS
jgi:hypothetical protein